MKAAALILRMADGKLVASAYTTMGDAMDAGRTVRDTGTHNGNPVDRGVVICSWKPCPSLRFRCDQAAKKSPAPAKRK